MKKSKFTKGMSGLLCAAMVFRLFRKPWSAMQPNLSFRLPQLSSSLPRKCSCLPKLSRRNICTCLN